MFVLNAKDPFQTPFLLQQSPTTSFGTYSLLQPLLLVVSVKLAPHSVELVLGTWAFLSTSE